MTLRNTDQLTVVIITTLDYSFVLWNPCVIKASKDNSPGMGKLTYHQHLSILELDSLELRRVLADLIFTYKLVFGSIDAGLYDFFVPRFNEFRRGHGYKLYLPTCKSNIRSNSFNYRVIQKCDSLPSALILRHY